MNVAANILNKQSRIADEGWTSSLGLGEVLTTPPLPHSDLREGVFLDGVSRSRKRDIFLGTWNVRSLHRAGSLTAAARELARYKLDIVGVQEVRWNKGG